jgi:2,3-diketo-5-methylthio-1-phosphopentane phosphatase
MLRVFCDFDGTVCEQDIGEQFFTDFIGAKAQEIVDVLLRGEIDAREWLRRECAALPPVTRSEFNAYLDRFTVDPSFGPFLRFAEERKIPVTVLSDGFDAYIEYVLLKNGLGQVPFFANHAEFTPGGSLNVTFPHTDAECTRCGNCKRNHMLSQSADEDVLVYIGDGFSDRCPVRYADIVFAKRQLIKHCQQQNITYYEFRRFDDVQKKMEEILQRKRIRHRQEAVMARREVYMQG